MGKATIVIDVIVNTANAQAKLAEAGKSTGKFQSAMGKMVAPAAAVVTAITGVAMAAVDSASRTQQAMGGLDAVFGSSSGQMKDWAATAAETTGLSAAQYAEATAKIGSQLKNLGLPIDQAAAKSDELVRMGADLAATFGGTTADAVDALGAALRGEADPAERYGLALNQTAVKAQMAKDGTDKLTGAAYNQAKAAALLKMTHEQAAGAVGQFARESNTAAGSAEIAKAKFQDASSALGTALLPAVAAAARGIAKFAAMVQKYPTAFRALIIILGALAVAILVVNAAMWVMSANPIVLIVAAIVVGVIALIAVLVILWKKFDGASKAAAVWAAIKTAITAVGTAARAVAAWFVAAWAQIVNIVNVVKAAITQFGLAVVAGFQAAWSRVVTIVSAAIAVVVAIVRAVIGVVVGVARALSPPFVLAFRVAQVAAQLFAAIVSLAIRVMVALVQSAANIIRAVWSAAWNAVSSAASAVFARIRAGVLAVSAVVRAVASAISNVFRVAWAAVRQAAASMASAVSSAISRLTAPARAAAAAIRGALSSVFSWMRSAAASAASAVGSALQRPISAATSAAARIKSAFISAFSALRSAASGLGSALAAPFHAVAGAISRAIGLVQGLIAKLNSIHVPSIKMPSLKTSTMAVGGLRTAPTARVASVGTRTTTAASGGVVVNVTGALDPEAVARQIRTILTGASVRRRGVIANLRTA